MMALARKSQSAAPFLFLFGVPRIERAGKPVDIHTRKAFALLAYLAITGTSHSRDTLAAFLWSEYDQTPNSITRPKCCPFSPWSISRQFKATTTLAAETGR